MKRTKDCNVANIKHLGNEVIKLAIINYKAGNLAPNIFKQIEWSAAAFSDAANKARKSNKRRSK